MVHLLALVHYRNVRYLPALLTPCKQNSLLDTEFTTRSLMMPGWVPLLQITPYLGYRITTTPGGSWVGSGSTHQYRSGCLPKYHGTDACCFRYLQISGGLFIFWVGGPLPLGNYGLPACSGFHYRWRNSLCLRLPAPALEQVDCH